MGTIGHRKTPQRGYPLLVEEFTGEHAYLSNFYAAPLAFIGDSHRVYPSAEHAFNALKTSDPIEHERIRSAPTPARAKYEGRRATLRPGWDEGVRFDAMREVVAAKFADEELRCRLLDTGEVLLVEGNTWHDQTWGSCTCAVHRAWPGQNWLGRILMDTRAADRDRPEDVFPRVAVTGHRPDAFTPEQAVFARDELSRIAGKLRDEHETTTAISGMALGADTWWAHAALDTGLNLWSYVPFWDQGASWTLSQQADWSGLLDQASHVDSLGTGYDVRLLHARNDWMIRDANLIVAVTDPRKTTGGTASTIKKAIATGRAVIAIDVEQMRTRWLHRGNGMH